MQDSFIRKFTAGNFEITITGKKPNPPIDILEKLYRIRNDETLADEEKNNQIQKIMREYME